MARIVLWLARVLLTLVFLVGLLSVCAQGLTGGALVVAVIIVVGTELMVR